MTIYILAIETSTDACSVSLLKGDDLYSQFELAPQQHAHRILPMIDSVLKAAEIVLEEVAVLSFGRGPGSFTGLRIAASVIQGLSVGLQKPVVPISTLRALAQKAYREKGAVQVVASLDARMQERYWGLFKMDPEGIMQPVSEEHVSAEKEMILPEGDWTEGIGLPDAQDVALLAKAEYALGNSVSAENAIPVYVRDKVTG